MTPTRRRAMVTGALGFIGGAVSDRLRADGWTVTGVDLRADASLGVVAGDITERGEWERAADGADLVVHTAAHVSNTGDLAHAWRINVLGTRQVVEAAAAGGAGRLLLLSSVRAFSDTQFPDGVDERWPVRPDGNPYVDTKIAAEQVALQAHAAGEVEVTVVRPGDVYGPGSRPWTILPLEAIRSRRFALPAMGRGVFSPVFIDDLVEGLVLAGTDPRAAGQVFTISHATAVTCREFFGHYFRMLGRRGPVVLPTPVALALAAAGAAATRAAGGSTEVNPATVRYLARRGTYSTAKARSVLGFEPRVPLDEGMRRTEAWLREAGHLL